MGSAHRRPVTTAKPSAERRPGPPSAAPDDAARTAAGGTASAAATETAADRTAGVFTRGLYAAAVRDIEAYLRYSSHGGGGAADAQDERKELWGHVKALRRRLASLN